MSLQFDPGSGTDVIRDRRGRWRALLHGHRPRVMRSTTARRAAEDYLRQNQPLLELARSQLRALDLPPSQGPIDAGIEYRFLSEKRHFDVTTVTFHQTCLGLPVWQAGISVHLKDERLSRTWLQNLASGLWPLSRRMNELQRFRIISCQTTMHPGLVSDDLRVRAETAAGLESLDSRNLLQRLGLADSPLAAARLDIHHRRLMIYRYEAAKRLTGPVSATLESSGRADPLLLPLPPLPPQIADDKHYLVFALYFDLKLGESLAAHWVALIEAETLSVLYYECLAAGINGSVFLADPMTTNGGPPPNSDNNHLNPLRVSAAMQGLDSTNPQELTGGNVKICDLEAPKSPPPTELPGADFVFDVRTDEFAAVNAYFHCDRFFRLVESLGFNRNEYFPESKFPTLVDHRGTPTTDLLSHGVKVDAQCRMKTAVRQDGSLVGVIDRTIFCLAETQVKPHIGNACDWRVVLHELGGHAVLFGHVNNAYLGFGHSAGDSLAAILSDPGSKAPDRGSTFPWTEISRRHDRCVDDGWAWGGDKHINDRFPYLQIEQILSTTHFRIYQSIGGGDSSRLDMQIFASRFMMYLILRAIYSLTPATNPQHVSDWLASLLVADAADWTSEGHSGGAYGKVICWGFEKQGLFGGAPPDVDVYIEDGRQGEYAYPQGDYNSLAIWNRLHDDGLEQHERPVAGVVNFAYVKIKNRGSQLGKSAVVNAFQSTPQGGLAYPDGWEAMETAMLSAGDVPPHSGSEVKVGPFKWIPISTDNAYILMAVSAAGDPSNLGKFSSAKPIPSWRLVPNDNNLGLRKV